MTKLRRLYQRWDRLTFFVKMFWVFTVAYLFTLHHPFYMCSLAMLIMDAIKRLENKLDDHMKGGSNA